MPITELLNFPSFFPQQHPPIIPTTHNNIIREINIDGKKVSRRVDLRIECIDREIIFLNVGGGGSGLYEVVEACGYLPHAEGLNITDTVCVGSYIFLRVLFHQNY